MASAEVITLAPHCALTPRGARLFFASVCLPCLSVAFICLSRGFWPVLPFAGLELLLLALVLRHSMRRRLDSQVLTLDEDHVAIETRFRQQVSCVVFSRHWAQVKLRRADKALHASRLMIESHGRSIEVGNFLNDDERHALAGRLMRLIGRVNESPPLGDAPATKGL